MNILEAARSGDEAAVRRAIEADPAAVAWRDERGESALMAAIYRGHHGIVDLLIASGAPLDVFAAAATGRVDELETAIAPGSSLAAYSYDGWTGLHLAAFFGHTDAGVLY